MPPTSNTDTVDIAAAVRLAKLALDEADQDATRTLAVLMGATVIVARETADQVDALTELAAAMIDTRDRLVARATTSGAEVQP